MTKDKEYWKLKKSEWKRIEDTQIIRHPRPRGITNTLHHLQQETNKTQISKYRKQIHKLIIEQWTLNNYQLNNELYSISKMSLYLGIRERVVQRYMNGVLVRHAGLYEDKDQGNKIARAIIFRSLFAGLEIKALTEEQVRILTQSQDGRFKPFVSATVNGAIKNLIDSQKPIMDILKIITEKDPAPIIGNLNIDKSKTATQYVTTEAAVKMVRDGGPNLIEDPAQLDAIIGQYIGLPNVDARTQDLTDIGIKTLATEKLGKAKGKASRKEKRRQFTHGQRGSLNITDAIDLSA